jgi:hypothetical protein
VRFFKLAAIGAVTVLFVAACGGAATSPTAATKTPAPAAVTVAPATAPAVAGTQPPAAATPPGPAGTTGGAGAGLCSLLTPADLQTATGKTYLPGTLDIGGQCNWNTDDSGANTGASSGNLIILAEQAEPLDFVKSSFGSGGSDATVNGHAAFWNPTEGLQSMWVDIGGGNVLVLSFPRSSDLTAADQTIAQKLAEIAVGNM